MSSVTSYILTLPPVPGAQREAINSLTPPVSHHPAGVLPNKPLAASFLNTMVINFCPSHDKSLPTSPENSRSPLPCPLLFSSGIHLATPSHQSPGTLFPFPFPSFPLPLNFPFPCPLLSPSPGHSLPQVTPFPLPLPTPFPFPGSLPSPGHPLSPSPAHSFPLPRVTPFPRSPPFPFPCTLLSPSPGHSLAPFLGHSLSIFLWPLSPFPISLPCPFP